VSKSWFQADFNTPHKTQQRHFHGAVICKSSSSGGALLYVKIRKIHAIEHHKKQRWGSTAPQQANLCAHMPGVREEQRPSSNCKNSDFAYGHRSFVHSWLRSSLVCHASLRNATPSLCLCVGLNGVNHSRADGLPDLWVPRAGMWVSEQKKRKAAKSQLTMRCKSAGEREKRVFWELM
jgi:hypothetical protein